MDNSGTWLGSGIGNSLPIIPSHTTLVSPPSNASDMSQGPTTLLSVECEPKQIHVTLSVAPWLNKSDTSEKDTLCEICLEGIEDGQKILKTSCCRFLAHCQCLSKWACTVVQGPLVEREASFTCPKCRTKMDLAKFERQVPRTTLLIDQPWALPSYDIEITFLPLSQSQYNPWDRSVPRPSDPETERLQQDSTGVDAWQRRLREQSRQLEEQARCINEQELRAIEQLRLMRAYHRHLFEGPRHEAERRRRAVELQRREIKQRRQEAELKRRQETERRWQEAGKEGQEVELRRQQAERERMVSQGAECLRNEAERRMQNAGRIRKREAARKNGVLEHGSGSATRRRGGARRRRWNLKRRSHDIRVRTIL